MKWNWNSWKTQWHGNNLIVHVEYNLKLPIMEPNLLAELTISITRNKHLLSNMLPQVTQLKDCKTYCNKKFTNLIYSCVISSFCIYLLLVGCISIKLGCTYVTLSITVVRLCVNILRPINIPKYCASFFTFDINTNQDR